MTYRDEVLVVNVQNSSGTQVIALQVSSNGASNPVVALIGLERQQLETSLHHAVEVAQLSLSHGQVSQNLLVFLNADLGKYHVL